MVYMLPRNLITSTALFVLLALLSASCGKRVRVITYEKKRGTTRHNTYKTPTRKKEEYFDFDDKRTVARRERAAASASSGNRSSAVGSTLKVIQTAQSFIGTPYRYGGSNRSGMDCSGLLCTSFESAGLKIPRSSNEQAEFGQKVSLRDIAPGDMVFFAERKGSSKITHAGLVTAVNGKDSITFIHSSTSRGVVEDNLLSDYYQGLFVKAVRSL